ncbi:MAG: sulfotransferase family protein [Acidimicrobiales bacterium]
MPGPAAPPVKVLLIAGTGRSGSTILANVVGQAPGFFSGGEFRYIWERGLIENRLCGCGARFRECELWSKVLVEAFGAAEGIPSDRLVAAERRVLRSRHLVRLFLGRRRGNDVLHRLGEYPAAVDALYRGVQAVTGARVIVDSSKLPAYGYVLDQLPHIDLRIVHLVRDPRASAYSWSRSKTQPDRGRPGTMVRRSPLRSAADWTVWNAAAQALWAGGHATERYLRVRYEDFATNPRAVADAVCDWLGESARPPFIDDRSIDLGVHHTVAGNPDRLQRGPVELRLDEDWRTAMSRRDRTAVTAVTFPLLNLYGYRRRIRPSEPARRGRGGG